MKRMIAAIIVALGVAAVGPSHVHAGTVSAISGGTAYAGYFISGAPSIQASVGPLFPASVSCTTASQTQDVPAASMQLGTVATSTNLDDNVGATITSSGASITSTSTVNGVNLLAGLIQATTVQAQTNSTVNGGTAKSTSSATFTNLTIAGSLTYVNFSGSVTPNTRVDLAGIGYVILNEQYQDTRSADYTSAAVNAIDVYVTLTNTLNVPVGSQIIIAHAYSEYIRTLYPATVSAGAWGLYATGLDPALSGSAVSGPWAWAACSCTGIKNEITLASLAVSAVGTTASMDDFGQGSYTATSVTANASSTVHTLNLLAGLVTGDVVNTTASATINSGTPSVSGTTTLTNVQIDGATVAVNPAANSKLSLRDSTGNVIGTVTLNEQNSSLSATNPYIEVVAIDIVISAANGLGLPVGAQIRVARSGAAIYTN